MFLDIFALVVIGILIAFIIWVVVLLGPMPGRIARERGHPQADAINALGWVGVITLGLAWPAALIWAYSTSSVQGRDEISARLAALEAELAALKVRGESA